MYEIIYSDGEIYRGGEPENSLWNDMPLKPIKKIEYNLLGHSIIFEGYESYNHLKEMGQFFGKYNKNRILKVYLMAKKGNIVYSFVFNLLDGMLYQETADFGKEYYGKPTIGWKEGMKDLNPTYNFI